MMCFWSHRPQFFHLGLFIAAYVLGCGFAQSLAIVPGTGISIWPASGLFIATLVVASRYSWPWWVLAGCLAELFSNFLWFHSPLPAAFLIYIGNALEAGVGAWLVNRTCRRPVRLETLQEVLAFVVLAAGIAPVVGATVGSATLAWFGIQSQTFVAAWPLWWIGDATGILIVAPLALVVFQNWRGRTELPAARWMEACVLGLIFLGVGALSLSGYLPFAYIIMPPLLWAAARFEFRGAAVALTLLALITAVFTISGDSQFAGDAESLKHKQIMLQLFLATSAFSALIVAAISRQHQLALLTLHQSVETLRDRERELSQLVDMVPVQIRRLTPEGKPTFFNKRLLDFFGLNDVAELDRPDMSRMAAAIKSLVHPEDAARLLETVRHSLATGEPYSMKYRMRRADGAYRWVDGRWEPLRDEGGVIVQWLAISIDIDDEVRAQEALRESERKLRQLIDAVPALIWSTTPEGSPSYINKRLIDMVGVTLEDLTASDASRSLADVHPDDRQAVEQALARSFETGTSFVMKYRQHRADGTYRWTEGRAEPLRDPQGRIVQWYGVCLDIDDLVTAQEALQQSERRYRDLFHYMPIGLSQVGASKLIPLFKELRAQGVTELQTYIDEHPEFLPRAVEALEVEEVNQHIIEMFGAKNAVEMHGPITRYWQPSISTIRRSIEARYRGEEVFQEETQVARMDGSVIDVLFTTARPGAVADKSLVGFIDITERKKAEMALLNREREFSQLVDMVPSLLWRLSPEGEPVFFSKRMIEFFGLDVGDYDRPESSGLAAAIAALVHPDDATRLAEALNHSFATGEAFSLNYRLRRADGVYRWMSARAEPLRDDGGRILQWYGLCHDIEDQMHAEETLRERERFLWQLVETLPALIDCAAPDGEPVYRSQQLREFLGYELEELDGAGKSRLAGTLDAGVHPDDVAGVKEQYAHSLSTGEPYARRHRLRRFDGEYRWVETRAAPMRNADGAIVQWNVICLDIDGEVRAQEKLLLAQESLARASQAASLAELSASIAHEVNQPLAAVMNYSSACQRWLTAEPPNIERAQKTVERIIHSANSAADVVSRIRALFRQSSDTRDCTTLGGVIAEVRELVAEEASRCRVRMSIEVEDDLRLVAFDRVQVQQVMINLIRNGMDAMASVQNDRVLRVRVHRMCDMVQTEISDHGRGVQFPDKIFEPFFTTKENGMGMGLAICRSIVEAHGGQLWAENNEPHGAKFIFTLPAEVNTAP
ncbi:PAS domain S-box-containing protein [Rhizobium mongolense subsp. loessense]|uniref:histidine kinase n=1 Tax=Rhizobium mongolense subsp. loessense TaxID=158890 RepID=A0A1G4QQE3_9HYPH|nr:PAS domain-containing protein [Rhizobium mongolense]SCW46752.1 PAS domain S-box-containing protein [Rhizobium mongolense subsp. loessense]